MRKLEQGGADNEDGNAEYMLRQEVSQHDGDQELGG